MAIRSVINWGDYRLYQKSSPVINFDTLALQTLAVDLEDTRQATQGVGIAAPQIGIFEQMIVFGVEVNPRYPHVQSIPITVLINPTITPLSEEQVFGWEGCLSVKGIRGLVPRYRHIRYSGFDVKGNAIKREASDFHARLLQHEYDHLQGILFPQRVVTVKHLALEEQVAPWIQDNHIPKSWLEAIK